jgi:hypothetical protein
MTERTIGNKGGHDHTEGRSMRKQDIINPHNLARLLLSFMTLCVHIEIKMKQGGKYCTRTLTTPMVYALDVWETASS